MKSGRVAITLGTLFAAALVFQGCSNVPTSPMSETMTALEPSASPHSTVDSEWYPVASVKMNAGQDGVVSGSRYTLEFSKGALHNAVQVTISERHPSILDVMFTPDGTEFDMPVTLHIDYSGTAFDRTDGTSGTGLAVFGFDSSTGHWKAVPGTNDATNRVYTAQLQHFSRYALADMTPADPKAPHNRKRSGEPVESN